MQSLSRSISSFAKCRTSLYKTWFASNALFCAGKCQQWLHRYCASVSVRCYKAIIDNSHPYCCPCCYRDSQQECISELTCTLEAMKLEIAQLKEALLTAQAAAAKLNSGRRKDFGKSSCDWHLVEKRSHGKRCSGCSGLGVAERKYQHHQQTESEKMKQRWHSVRTLAVKRPKEWGSGGNSLLNSKASPGGHGAAENWQVVDGVRRVWGTMRGCSYRTVLSTLQWLTTVAENVEVHRKFKKRGNTEVQWWFLIRGEETVLQNLDQECVNIKNSTSWKLERCYQLVSASATHDLVLWRA